MTDSRLPQDYPRRILLAVTGLSPQIVTETLYALGVPALAAAAAVPPAPTFLPTEVRLITTVEGADRARVALLHPDGGQFHSLLADFPYLGQPRFDDSCIHQITGPDGKPLTDIRSPEENAAAADSIAAIVREITADPDCALHVSIAGGRKTMGFYLGYALSLFARPQDRLSHVLVSSPFESHPDFFYPPRTPRRLATRDGTHIDTAGAVITLAEIPFVRLRHGLPVELQEGGASFTETVSAIQHSFAPPDLAIDLRQRSVLCGGKPVTLKPQLVAWLAWWALQAARGKPFASWLGADAALFLELYREVVGVDAIDYEDTAKILADGMEKEFFQTKNSKLERDLKKALGPAAAAYLLATSGKRPHTCRGLSLPPAAISIGGLPPQIAIPSERARK
jgi:CRISPR-associated protein (TIGR02584 family)